MVPMTMLVAVMAPSGSSTPMSRDRPKSAILMAPSRAMRMFSGLMSRWMTPREWAYSRAAQICGTSRSAASGETLPAAISARSDSPSTHSMTKK